MEKKEQLPSFYLNSKGKLLRYANLFAEVVAIMEGLPKEDPNKSYLKEQAFRLLEILDQELTKKEKDE